MSPSHSVHRSWMTGLVLWLATTFPSVHAQQDGDIIACKQQGCNDCPLLVNARAGYPECLVYNSGQNLGGYEDPDAINSYRVWWNSGKPASGCRIVVRTPASTTEPACGLYLTSWANAGCYYTAIQESFNVQFCCGEGDCDAASPASSVEEAQSRRLQGQTSVVSLQIPGMFAKGQDEGNFTFGEGLSATWKRVPSEKNGLANLKHPHKRAEGSYRETRRWSKVGQQIRVSPTQNCNAASCEISIQETITTGSSFSLGLEASDPLGIVSVSTNLEFSREQSRAVTNTYNQGGGTRGYVSFAPAFDCTQGELTGCPGYSDGTVEGCAPRLLPNGGQSGDYSFVYVQPGED